MRNLKSIFIEFATRTSIQSMEQISLKLMRVNRELMALMLYDEVKQFVLFVINEHQMQQANDDNNNVVLHPNQRNLLNQHQFEHDAFLLHNDMTNDLLPMVNMDLSNNKNIFIE